MENDTVRRIEAQGPGSILEEIARRGAQQMLAEAMEAEVAGFLAQHADKRDENGHRVVVRNGHMPARELITGIGRIPIEQPRIDDRQLAKGKEPRFSSAILPRYLKRVPSVDSLIPALYLKGVSTGDFSQALEAILGKQAPGLSANSVVRLKAVWEQEYQQWTRRDLSAKRYVYFWADGLHVNVRLDEERSCILVIMGADEHGTKELVAVSDGYRESTASWRELLLDLRRRGLSVGPRLATADGALGFWAALREVYPGTEEQTCWFHKAGNVLDKMPKSVQGRAKTMIRRDVPPSPNYSYIARLTGRKRDGDSPIPGVGSGRRDGTVARVRTGQAVERPGEGHPPQATHPAGPVPGRIDGRPTGSDGDGGVRGPSWLGQLSGGLGRLPEAGTRTPADG